MGITGRNKVWQWFYLFTLDIGFQSDLAVAAAMIWEKLS